MKIPYRSSKSGFTLVELIVVIAIIAILTGIVVSTLVGSKAKSRDAKRGSDLAQIQLAIEQFFDRCDQYPIGSSGATGMPLLTANNGCPNGITLGNFISVLPTDPTNKSPYVYGYAVNSATSPTDYVLYVTFETTNSILAQSAPNPSWFTTSTFNCGNQATTPPVTNGLDYCVRPN